MLDDLLLLILRAIAMFLTQPGFCELLVLIVYACLCVCACHNTCVGVRDVLLLSVARAKHYDQGNLEAKVFNWIYGFRGLVPVVAE